MSPKTAKFLRAALEGIIGLYVSFLLLRPVAEIFAVLIRRHWPAAWFSGFIVWYLDLLAAGLSIAIGITVWRYSLRAEDQTESKADRTHRLLYACEASAVMIGVFQWAEGHYFRALLAAALFLAVIPWLGKRWISRSERGSGI